MNGEAHFTMKTKLRIPIVTAAIAAMLAIVAQAEEPKEPAKPGSPGDKPAPEQPGA